MKRVNDYLKNVFEIFDESPLNKVILFGILLCLSFIVLGFLSPKFGDDIYLENMPILIYVIIMILSGAFYLEFIKVISLYDEQVNPFFVVLLLGIIMRILMFFSTPIITKDYYRYLWDGAVLANGVNPYLYSPDQIQRASEATIAIPSILESLSTQQGSTLSKIIFPDLRTPYPPVAQLFFALSYIIKPWSLLTWRSILFIFDLITLILLYQILTKLGKSTLWISVYWLNPIFLKEIINSGHMDILIIPFLLSGILFIIQKKYYISIFFLTLSIGIKIWPIVLLPLFIRQLFPGFKKIILASVFSISLCLMIFYPVYISGIDNSLGLLAYIYKWEYNDSLFKIILFLSNMILTMLNIDIISEQFLARFFLAILFSLWVLYVTYKKTGDQNSITRQCTYIIAALLLLSPTQFPWYYIWLIPFLVFNPIKPLLLLTLLFPIYYVRFYFFSVNQVELFDNFIVWLQYLPVWIFISYEWFLNRYYLNETKDSKKFEA